ncbi:MAG: Ppx/GppA phosphatase family protein [Rhizobiaceae bacterium]
MSKGSQGRFGDREPVAIIDIGSNSIRLVVYEGLVRAPTMMFNEKMLAGLGRGIALTGRLDPDAVSRALDEFRRFRAILDQIGVESVEVIATAAAREAVNGKEFIAAAQDILRVPIRVLTGREEAWFAALGIRSGFHHPDGIAGDMGGGSLELIDIRGERTGEGITLPLGGLRLQDSSGGSLAEARKIARKEIARADFLGDGAGRTFYAIGGGWRNLARLHMLATAYPLGVMHHYELDLEDSGTFLRQVAKGEIDAIRGIARISRSRRALLANGAIVLLEIIEAMKPARVVVSGVGVREGFLYSRLTPHEQNFDPLITAADELAVLRSRSVEHARELAHWTGASFAALGISETLNETRSRIAACLLADIAWRAHPDYRGAQSLNLISHASLMGIDHPSRVFIALANLWRHEGLDESSAAHELVPLAPERLVQRARVLAALMRVVYIMTASMPGLMPRLKWEDHGDAGLVLRVPKDKAGLIGERPKGRLEQLARIVGLDLTMDVSSN